MQINFTIWTVMGGNETIATCSHESCVSITIGDAIVIGQTHYIVCDKLWVNPQSMDSTLNISLRLDTLAIKK